jgi:hypothetical protein
MESDVRAPTRPSVASVTLGTVRPSGPYTGVRWISWGRRGWWPVPESDTGHHQPLPIGDMNDGGIECSSGSWNF